MKQFKIHYTGNTYKELSVIFNKMNWKVIKSDETEFDGELTDGSFISNEYNRIFLVNKNGEIPVDIITKYEFNIRKNKQSTLLFFSYKIVEIKTNIEINNLNDNKNLVEIKKLINSKDLLEIKELIDNKFYFKKEIITNQLIRKRQNIIGRNFEPPFEEKYDSDSNYEFMILLQLMKKLDKRLELIEKAMLSNTSTLKKEENIKFDDKVLSIDEVSKLLGLAKATIYSKASRKELPYIKRGKKLYFMEKEIIDYLKGGKILSNDEIDEISKNYISNSTNKKK